MGNESSKLQEILDVFPTYFKQQQSEAQQGTADKDYQLFNVHQPKFACLADKDFLSKNLSELVKIEFTEELNHLSEDHQIEIIMPVLGLTDLLNNDQIHVSDLMFSPPVAINGFGSVQDADAPAHPDYILATDIMGNQYEVLVNEQGVVELPQEGTGLFSMLSYLTFIYSEWQVKKGVGFENLTDIGIEPGYIYLLPPMITKDFTTKLAVTHLDDYNHRVVDTLRSIDVSMKSSVIDSQVDVSIEEKDDLENAYEITASVNEFSSVQTPQLLKLSLDTTEHSEFSLTSPNNPLQISSFQGWQQNSMLPNTFIKQLGINQDTKTKIIRDIYSEADFTKDYVSGDHFGLSEQNGFNNFMLFPEAIGSLYDFVTDGIVNHQITGNFIWDRVSQDTILALDLQHVPVSFYDSVILSDTLSHQDNQSVETIKSWFDNAPPEGLHEQLTIFSNKSLSALPEVSFELVYDHATDLTNSDLVNHSDLLTPEADYALSQPLADLHEAQSFAQGMSDRVEMGVGQSSLHSEQGVDLIKLNFGDVIIDESAAILPSPTESESEMYSQAGTVFGTDDVASSEVYYVQSPTAQGGPEWHLGFTQIPDSEG